jgi:uncharacterized repeat protein (TIGR01451 family)
MRKKLLPIVIVSIVAVSVVVAAILLHWGREPSTPSTLTILSMTEGNVSVMKTGTDSWIEAQVGMSLEPGDTVKSGNSSNAKITFFDGSTIELEAGTQIEVVSLGISDTGSTTIKLKQTIGNTISRVTKLVDSASSYEVETPACVAAVRGSVMLVNIIEDGTTWVTNQEGNIWVIANGVELQIPEGRKCIIISGQSPQLVPSGDEGGGGGGGGGGEGGGLPPPPDIAITKMPDLTQVHEGDVVTYTYTVTNPGHVPLSHVSVTDDRIKDVTYQSGDSDGDGRLDVNETWIFTAIYTITAEDESPLVNRAVAAGTYAARTIIAWTTASVEILQLAIVPAIALDKTAEPTQAYVGDNITYTYTVTNAGNTPLSDISVIDDRIEGIAPYSGDTNEDGILDVNETWIFTAIYTITAADESPLVNNATVYGTYAPDQTVTAQATASVTIIVTETASISVEVESGPEAPIYIWDTTTNNWAIDQSTGQAVNGTNHTTNSTIAVAGGHHYCVWVEDEYYYHLSVYPEGWEISYYPVPGHEVEAACGYAYAGELDSVTFFVTASIQVQITGLEPPTASIYIWDNTTGAWAIDEYTEQPVDGSSHTTPGYIAVAGGHYYYVWVEVEYASCMVSGLPEGWDITYYPPPEGYQAAYGYAAAGGLYPVDFTAYY